MDGWMGLYVEYFICSGLHSTGIKLIMYSEIIY